jgi:hypothetical protein
MSVASVDAGRGFGVGNVIVGAWNLFVANLAFFVAVTLIAALPGLLFHLTHTAEQPEQIGWSAAIPIIAGTILNTLAQAVILFVALEHLRGLPVRPGEAFRKTLGRFFPLLALGVLYSLAVGIGFALLIVPGLVLLVMWAVVVPACVAENLGPIASLSRSANLTKGHRWTVFWVIVPVVIVSAGVSFLLDWILGAQGSLVSAVAGLIWTAVWFAYWNCVLVIMYHELRVVKEATDIHQIAAQAGH